MWVRASASDTDSSGSPSIDRRRRRIARAERANHTTVPDAAGCRQRRQRGDAGCEAAKGAEIGVDWRRLRTLPALKLGVEIAPARHVVFGPGAGEIHPAHARPLSLFILLTLVHPRLASSPHPGVARETFATTGCPAIASLRGCSSVRPSSSHCLVLRFRLGNSPAHCPLIARVSRSPRACSLLAALPPGHLTASSARDRRSIALHHRAHASADHRPLYLRQPSRPGPVAPSPADPVTRTPPAVAHHASPPPFRPPIRHALALLSAFSPGRCRLRLNLGSSAGLVIGRHSALSMGTDDRTMTKAGTDTAVFRPFRADLPYSRTCFTKPAEEPGVARATPHARGGRAGCNAALHPRRVTRDHARTPFGDRYLHPSGWEVVPMVSPSALRISDHAGTTRAGRAGGNAALHRGRHPRGHQWRALGLGPVAARVFGSWRLARDPPAGPAGCNAALPPILPPALRAPRHPRSREGRGIGQIGACDHASIRADARPGGRRAARAVAVHIGPRSCCMAPRRRGRP